MDMTEYGNGSIFANIIHYNNELSKKLKAKMDLKTINGLDGEQNPDGVVDQTKALEDKLDTYIVDFVNLNERNQAILTDT
jgi:hypothetical protein